MNVPLRRRHELRPSHEPNIGTVLVIVTLRSNDVVKVVICQKGLDEFIVIAGVYGVIMQEKSVVCNRYICAS